MMEVEKPWEFKEEVDIMEEYEEDDDDTGALHTRERKSKAADHDGNGEPDCFNEEGAGLLQEKEEEQEQEQEQEQKQSVFFDSTSGLWKCRHCDWTYRLSSPCRDDILNHQGYCQIARNLELLVRNEPFYYSSDKVLDNATETSMKQEITKVEQSSCERGKNNEIAEGKELEKQESFYAQENNKSVGNDKLENGLQSNGLQEASSSSETTADGEAGPKLITTIVDSANSLANRSGALDISNRIINRTQLHEIEVEADENDTKSKVNIEEYDLEKILDKQETHELYCPSCKSCITRRVILRKRKRTVRQTSRDEPPKKTQVAEPSADASNQMAAARHDQDAPEVFRCLSCFTFFIPAGCGFNIFRIFERSGVNQQVWVQHPSASHESENCGSWLLSCFQTVDSPKKSVDADPAKNPLLSDSQTTIDKISSAKDNTTFAHIHATNGKTQVSKKTSSAGSSSTAQQLHGTTSSTVTVHASSSVASTISSSQSKTDSEPASDVLADAIHLDSKEDVPQNTTVVISDRNPLFKQEFFRPNFKLPDAIPTKVLPVVDNQLPSQESVSVIPAPVELEPHPHVIVPITHGNVPPTPVRASSQRDEWDVLKAIVYGGLLESITSLSVVSAAAASGTKTLDVFVLGIANLIGGLPIIFHSIADLRNLGDANEDEDGVGHYWLQLGRRSKHQLHMVVGVASYTLFGLLPPLIYGLSFRKSDDREGKMMAVAAASLACIALLAIGKAHVVRRPSSRTTYFTTLLYYVSVSLSCCGLSYVAGVLITRLLAHFGLIDHAPPGLLLPEAMGAAWASY